ncbi:hypothetical protein V1264_017776 [Littorina saxatilis]|uniref:Uncharacterized protein n=1 Tax=Littorina saxatilis TaxID=31220 RepID=A0AAN9BJW1_9CAEN
MPLLPALGCGVAAALLVVVLVVVIVIVVLKRRETRTSIPETATVSDYGYLTPVNSSPSQPEETGGVYHIVHESDMRLSGLYATAEQPGNMPDLFNGEHRMDLYNNF